MPFNAVYRTKSKAIFIVNLMTLSDVPIFEIKEAGEFCYFKVKGKYKEKLENVLRSHEKEFEKINDKTPRNILKSAIQRVGLWIGLAAAIAVVAVWSNTVRDINISGNELVSTDSIIEVVANNYTLPTGKNDFDLDNLEKDIIQMQGVANVSLFIKGNVLFIKILEELKTPEIIDYSEITPLKSNYDAVVTKIVTYKGTSIVNVGDTVKKGEILIEPRETSASNETTEIKALGDVYGRVWLSESNVFTKTVIKSVRTGNKKTVYLNSFSEEIPLAPFATYETEEKIITDYCFFPIKLKEITYYETKEIESEFDYLSERNQIIEDKTKELEDRIPDGAEKVRTWFSEKTVDKNVILVIYYEIVIKISD